MRSKLAGHSLQLLGYTLTFLGLGVSAAAFLLAGNYPTVPLWVFVTAAVVIGAPVMIAGGRIDGRGRGRVLGLSPERAAQEYREKTLLMALFLAFVFSHSAIIISPLILRLTGLAQPSDELIGIWLIVSMLTLCACRDWISRPVWSAIERRVVTRDTGVARSP